MIEGVAIAPLPSPLSSWYTNFLSSRYNAEEGWEIHHETRRAKIVRRSLDRYGIMRTLVHALFADKEIPQFHEGWGLARIRKDREREDFDEGF